MASSFDLCATEYDRWFLDNERTLRSELALLASCLGQPGRALSVGCGSGLFEWLLHREHGVHVANGIEPSEAMAAIARERGLEVRLGTAETAHYGDELYDTVLLNGTPSYIDDLAEAFRRSFVALKGGGRIVVLDVPKESGFGTLYALAAVCGSWEDPRVRDIRPAVPYPIELTMAASWRTTSEKLDLLERAGFVEIESFQTLTRHPAFADAEVESPIPGHDRGDYVGIIGRKPLGSSS
jgi:SAM-dependent methyltransferase